MNATILFLVAGFSIVFFIAGGLLGIRYGRRTEREYWSGRFKEETRKLEAEMAAEKLECWLCPACGKASESGSRNCDWCFAPRPEAYQARTLSRLEYQNQSDRPLFPEM